MHETQLEKEHMDNPNPEAETAFVIYFPFQYFVYKNIYKHLDKSEFVIDFGALFPDAQPDGLMDEIVQILKKNRVYYRILYHSDYYLEGYLKDFFSKYKALVSVWEQGCILLDCNLDKKKINLTYGAGKELTQVRFTRRLYDLILAFGERDSKLFSLFATTKAVGNPKFDDWFNEEFDQDLLIDLGSRLSKDKKTILYLPTHGDLCSLNDLAAEMKKISSEYNVIAKIHYHTIKEEPEKIERIRHSSIIILGDEVDLLTLLKISNVVVSDNSSAIFDAMLADKPIIATSFLSDEYLDVSHKSSTTPGGLNKGAMTYSGSIEQLVKKEKKVIVISKPEELGESVKKAILDDGIYKGYRRELSKELFAFQDGRCGERAASEIKKLISSDTPRSRPIMYHAVEGFLQGIPKFRYLSLNLRLQDKKRINQLENIYFRENEQFWKHKIIFSVIVLDYDNKYLEKCLQSLLYQELPGESYEIIVISKSERDDVSRLLTRATLERNSEVSVKFVHPEGKSSLNLEIKKAVQSSRGEYVCFTESNYLLSSKWLLDMLLVFQRFPTVAAVGGYEESLAENGNLFDDFDTLEIGRLLGTYRETNFRPDFYELKNNLFYHNPAGSLANISYKKTILEKLEYIFDDHIIKYIELELKRAVMTTQEICFSPVSVRRMDKMTLKKFNQKNMLEGFAYSRLCENNPELKKHFRCTIFSPMKSMLWNIFDGPQRRKIALSAIIFLAVSGRWLGGLNWKLLSFSSKIRRTLL